MLVGYILVIWLTITLGGFLKQLGVSVKFLFKVSFLIHLSLLKSSIQICIDESDYFPIFPSRKEKHKILNKNLYK
ncbi:hypothetical protein M3676_22070 [Metabacillus litoralis]|nr:hypothetical protein [Metabacillus litoralis]